MKNMVRSCETQLLLTINNPAESLNSNGQADEIPLDFSKAINMQTKSLPEITSLWHPGGHFGMVERFLYWKMATGISKW